MAYQDTEPGGAVTKVWLVRASLLILAMLAIVTVLLIAQGR